MTCSLVCIGLVRVWSWMTCLGYGAVVAHLDRVLGFGHA